MSKCRGGEGCAQGDSGVLPVAVRQAVALELPNALDKNVSFDIGTSGFILTEDSAVRFGMCRILMEKEMP